MADKKLNTGPAENISPEAAEPIATPEQAAASEPQQEQTGPAIPESGDVVVSFDKINELMAEKRQNARAEVEKSEPPETPEAAAPGETPQPANTEEPKKPRRGRPPKAEKAATENQKSEKSAGARKGRPPKADKAAPDKPKPSKRDKVSRSDGKAPDAKEPIKPAQDTALKETAAVEQTAPEPTTPPRPVEEGKLVYLKLSEVHPFHTFRPHPFKVRDDAKMQEIVASIRVNGVMVPGLARPEKDGNGYEIVAGHRRTHGSELAGLEEMPFIVREMTDHEAVQAMKDSNKQRDGMLPSELAALLELEVEDIKHQGGRLKDVAEGDVGKRSVEIVGEAHEMNYKKVMRYLRLNSLVPELLDKVDDKKMGFMPAVELSYIRPKNQRLIAVSIDGEQASPSLAQAKRLRELDKEGKLNGDVIDGILGQDDKGVITFNISEDGIQDTVKFDKNGDIYVNGNKVVISSTNGFDSEQTIVPQTSTVVEHSLIPFAGTMTYQYSQLLYSHKCANINAGSVIGSLTVTAITMIISKAVVSIFASPIAGDAVSLFAAVATELKTEAQENAPDSAYFSYNYSKYKYPDSPLTDSYFRYFGLYYPKKDLVGSPATSDIFEHCVNSYI